jgi:serine beta-lactamase-like protein LACTB, mitochondrial
MAMSRTQTWLAVIVLAVGGLIAAILGLFAYVSATATPLHPNAQDMPSVISVAPPTRWADAVEKGQRLVRTDVTEQNLPGVSVAVGIDGDLVWAEGFGWANLETKVRVTPVTRFRTGATSVPLASAAVGLLLETDRLKLDDEIQKYVPAFPKKQWPVTLRQVMGHVAGLVKDQGDEEPISERCDQTTDALRRFAENKLLFEPGTKFRYSSYGWILMSAAIEAAAGESFFSFLRTQIVEPLKMDGTRADSSTEPIADLATFYHPRFGGNPRYGPELAREGDYSCFAGAGGLLSTPSDLVRFGLAVSSGTLLQPATVALLQTPQRLTSGEETGYGLGWDLETVSIAGAPAKMVGHDTEVTLGASASLAMFPERGIVVSVMTNTTFADTSAIAVRIAQVFAEQRNTPAHK